MLSWRAGANAAALAALAALILALPRPAAGHSNDSFVLFPESEQVFRQLIADPRHIALGINYYRLAGKDVSDAALGHSWGLAHWESPDGVLQYQTNMEAMAYSRFIVGGSVNEFETVDFFANLPLAVKHGPWASRFMLYHESSHLGDDFIRRTGDKGFRFSTDGVQLHFSVDALPGVRLYAGAKYLLHTVPAPQRITAQYGFEFTTADLNRGTRFPMRLFLAQDFQNPENVDYHLNSNTEAGVIVGFSKVKRFMRVFGGYYTGRSPYGQFFRQKEHYLDLGVSFHL